MSQIRVGILFGGRSAEHEVSLQSARNVINALDRTQYEPVLIGIDKTGRWYLYDEANYLCHATDPKRIQLNTSNQEVMLVPGGSESLLIRLDEPSLSQRVDVVFPVLHGTYGEDGTVQGLLKLVNVPFVGVDVLAAAVCMDKEVTKRLLRDAGIPNADFLTFRRYQRTTIDYRQVTERLGTHLFIKPANLGSSVGIRRARNEDQFWQAVDLAFEYDTKLIVEQAIPGREIEIAVLGNENPIASLPGEVISPDFYSYEAKYITDESTLHIPAELPKETIQRLQELATRVFRVLECEGMARVDFFLQPDGALLVNEVNTIPGFTPISMYPKLWAVSGLAYPDLIDRLIQLAIERHQRDQQLKTTFSVM